MISSGDKMEVINRYKHLLQKITEGYYVIGADGSIKNKHGKQLNRTNAYGYKIIDIKHNGRAYTAFQHKLLYAYYHGLDALDLELTIDHLNGDKLDNSRNNLEQVTRAENGRRSVESKPTNGTLNGNSKLTEDDVRLIRKLKPTHSCSVLAEQFDISPSAIKAIVNFKTWRHVL
jgi:hypothetical protein